MNTELSESQPVILTQNTPRPFSEIPALWLQLPHMTQAFFAAEAPHASSLNTFLSVAVYSVMATVIAVLVAFLRELLMPSEYSSVVQRAAFITGCLLLFIAPVSFYLNAGLNYLGALVFGGKGRFSEQAYLASLFFVPVGMLSSMIAFLSLIPYMGPIVEWPLLLVIVIVTTVLQYRVIRVVHGLTSGRALGAVLAPHSVIICVCLPIAVGAALMILGPVIGNTFSTINQSLLTPAP